MAFSEQSFVVVGGTGGIGFEISKALLNEGVDRLAIFDQCDTRNVVEQLRTQFPARVITFAKVDVRDRQSIKDAFQSAVDRFQHIDGMVNAAGICREWSSEDTIGVNVIGVINGTQIALEHMSVEKGGRGGLIVNVASVVGLDYFYSIPIYTASKHAVVGYTRSLADKKFESRFGVKFVTICPGFTNTPLVGGFRESIFSEDLVEDSQNFVIRRGMQSAEECGCATVEAMKESVNGSIWIVDNNTIRPVTLKTYWNLD